jgi:hypothetical protein
MFRHDPIEDNPAFQEAFKLASEQATKKLAELGFFKGTMGYCHAHWAHTKNALREMGIEWRTPAEMNPGVCFD